MPHVSVLSGSTRASYAPSMPPFRQDDTIRRGAEIAIARGWPKERIGLLGAFASVLDIGAPMRRLRSSTYEIPKRRADANRAAAEYMRARGKRSFDL